VNREEIVLIYDKECPACNNYCQVIRVREDVGNLKIINARESSTIRDEITAMGLDLDQGMVLKMGEKLYYGSDAIHALALISSRSGIFNRINYWIFRSKTLSAVVYPLLRSCRNFLLKILVKSKINNLGISGNDKF
jgi:predicted DCC family thiol-disulfide oxidoreductase YuxK